MYVGNNKSSTRLDEAFLRYSETSLCVVKCAAESEREEKRYLESLGHGPENFWPTKFEAVRHVDLSTNVTPQSLKNHHGSQLQHNPGDGLDNPY